jgi:hypothetical protein
MMSYLTGCGHAPIKIDSFCALYQRVIPRDERTMLALVKHDRPAAEANEINETTYERRCKNG